MKNLVYPRERMLGDITLALGLFAWLGLILGTFGVALIVLAVGFLLYLFAQSALIAHIKGNGVELSESQYPDLHAQFVACCDRLQMKTRPRAYILSGGGSLNAFATRFLGTQYVVLLSDVVDAMAEHVDGVRFYIGHELGHLRMKHLSGHFFRWPVLWLPLLGAAYSRARETTCDRHGLACSGSPEGAVRALAALSAGAARWKDLNVSDYVAKARRTPGFWMSFHELTAGYPWLTKRAARLMGEKTPLGRRNPFAYLLALFVPYAGRLGAGFGAFVMVYMIAVLAAVAIPAYQDYTTRAKVAAAVDGTQQARDAISSYFHSNQQPPESLEAAGVEPQLADGTQLSLDPDRMELTVRIKQGEIVFTPMLDDKGKLIWSCENGEGLKPTQLPPSCRRIASK